MFDVLRPAGPPAGRIPFARRHFGDEADNTWRSWAARLVEVGAARFAEGGVAGLAEGWIAGLAEAGLLALLRPVGGPFSSNPRIGLVDASPGGVTASGGFDDMWRGYNPS